MNPPIIELVEKLAQWCINRAAQGDVTTDVLVDNVAAMVKKVIAAKAH